MLVPVQWPHPEFQSDLNWFRPWLKTHIIKFPSRWYYWSASSSHHGQICHSRWTNSEFATRVIYFPCVDQRISFILIQNPGSRIMDPESWIQDPGSRIQDRIQDAGSWILDRGPWILDPGFRMCHLIIFRILHMLQEPARCVMFGALAHAKFRCTAVLFSMIVAALGSAVLAQRQLLFFCAKNDH